MRLLIAALTVCLFAACGGGSTPTPSPTTTTSPITSGEEQSVDLQGHACKASDVQATLIDSKRFGFIEYLTFSFESRSVNFTGAAGCLLTNAPNVHWYYENGDLIHIPWERGPDCDSADHSRCIEDEPVGLLPPGRGIPAGVAYGSFAVVSVDHSDELEKCMVREQPSRIVGFEFPDPTGEVQADLPEDVSFGCSPKSKLEAYGPNVSGSPSLGGSAFAPNCTLDRLAGSYVFTAVALGTDYYEFGISNTGEEECKLAAPSELHLLDASGSDLPITYATNSPCDLANQGTPCPVTFGPIQMLPDKPAPVAGDRGSGQVTATVAIGNIAYFDPPCATSFQAHTVGLVFPGTDGELRMDLPRDVGVQTCQPQVILHRFD